MWPPTVDNLTERHRMWMRLANAAEQYYRDQRRAQRDGSSGAATSGDRSLSDKYL